MKSNDILILHLDSNHPHLSQTLQNAGFSNDFDLESSKETILKKIQDYHGIVIRSRFAIDKDFIDAAENLQFIARVGAGLENIDCDYATSKNIQLIAAPEGNRNAVGEHTLALLLSLLNKVTIANSEIRDGHWNREKNRGYELDGKTVGIIGYGNMGKSFAKKLRGFDVKVICHDIVANVGDVNAKQVSLDELQAEADVVSLHVPWTAETDRMVDAQFIAAFAKPIWFLNTSRGKNVVTTDLVEALKSGKIVGAGLDVLEYEKSSFENFFHDHLLPESFQELLGMDNVIITPHVAGWTVESSERLAQVIVEKITALYAEDKNHPLKPAGVTGIGGVFFKANDPTILKEWYQKHLGLNVDPYGCTFWWKDNNDNPASTQWSPFKADTSYFDPSPKQFMQNFRVDDLDRLLAALEADGVTLVGTPESHDYGKFAWILDPEGNKIELWQPNDSAFL
ncbi:MAG: hydroxyacid dehydrogenase [Flavobacterium sp.]|nr:hydroxyacid dehydrogenase [Flavobacterium sp.]